MRRRLVLPALSALVAVLLLGAPAAAQRRPAPERLAPVPVHLALGDSVAAGVGASDPDATGYVPLVSAALRGRRGCGASQIGPCRRLETVNVAVSGATTTSLIADQLPEALAILAARNGDRSAANDVEAITLDIGGNDVFPLVQVCGVGVTPECVAAAQQRLTEVAANLDLILGSLRAAAPDTPIVVTTYYNPLPGCALAALAPVGEVVLEGGSVLPLGLNDLIRTTAAAHDVAVADLYGALSIDDWVGGQDCLHPDDSGHEIIADLVAAAVDD